MFDGYMVLFVITNLSFLKYFSKNHTVAKVLNVVYLLLIILQGKGNVDLVSLVLLNTVSLYIYELQRTEDILRKYCSLLNQMIIFLFKITFEYYSIEYILCCFLLTWLIDDNLYLYIGIFLITVFFTQLIWRSNFEIKNFDTALKELEIDEIKFQEYIDRLDNSLEYQNVISYYKMLCFQEDKDFMENEKLFNIERVKRLCKNLSSRINSYKQKKQIRGYGTICGQITRCLFLNTGYSTKSRKIYEYVFARIHFSTIENYLITMSRGVKTKHVKLDKYVRYFYLHIYYTNIRSSGTIGRKTFNEIFDCEYYQAEEDEILIFLSTLYGDSRFKDNYYFEHYGKSYLVKTKRELINKT